MTMADFHEDHDFAMPPSPWERWLDSVEALYGARVLGTPDGHEKLDHLYSAFLRGASCRDAAAELQARPSATHPWERFGVLLAQLFAVGALIGSVAALAVFFFS